MNSPNNCPLTGKRGRVIRKRKPNELAQSYSSYLGAPLPPQIIERYFSDEITECFSPESGLRWYSPANLGDGDYYATLAELYSWYYNPGSWDKVTALDIIRNQKPSRIAEVGSGSGWLLEKLKINGVDAFGVEINPQEVRLARDKGLKVIFPEEVPKLNLRADWLCLLQTIEHVENPVAMLQGYIQQFNSSSLIISAPCFESLLGHTKDPLSWPPHHATAWSKKAFMTLGIRLGFDVVKTVYSPMTYFDLESCFQREGTRKLSGLPYFPSGRLGLLMFRLMQRIGFRWALRGHSILVVMTKTK